MIPPPIPFPSQWFALVGLPVQQPDIYIPSTSVVQNPVFQAPLPTNGWIRVVDYYLNEISFSARPNVENFLREHGFSPEVLPPTLAVPTPTLSDIWVAQPPQFIEGTQFSHVRIVDMRVWA